MFWKQKMTDDCRYSENNKSHRIVSLTTVKMENSMLSELFFSRKEYLT